MTARSFDWPGEERRKPRRSSPTWLVRHALAGWLAAEAEAAYERHGRYRVLDVGCGPKPYYPFFAEWADDYVGVDVPERADPARFRERRGIEGPYFLYVGRIVESKEMPELPSHWMTYFATDDVDATVETATKTGAVLRTGPMDTPYGRMAVLEGPFGEVFSVITGSSDALR